MTTPTLPDLPDASAWMTNESAARLDAGGNCKGAVPVHRRKSSTARNPLFSAYKMHEFYAQGRADERAALSAAPAAPTATTRGGWFLDCGQSNIGVLWQQVEAGTDGAVWLGEPSTVAQQAAEHDVRRILLDIVPGDGSGLEIYAKTVADVEAKLTQMGERIEELESAAHAQQQAAPQTQHLLALLARYRDEVPLGHQPHMIAHLADDALGYNGADAQRQAATVQPLSEAEIEDCIDEATRLFNGRRQGPGGQQITTYDDWKYWLVRVIERAHGITATQQAATVQPLSPKELESLFCEVNGYFSMPATEADAFRSFQDAAQTIEANRATAWGLTLAGTATQQAPTDTAKD